MREYSTPEERQAYEDGKADCTDALDILEEIVCADDAALAEYKSMGLGGPPPETTALTEKARAVLKRHGRVV